MESLKQTTYEILKDDAELLLLFNIKFDSVEHFSRHIRTLIALNKLTQERFEAEVKACVSEYNRQWRWVGISQELIKKFNGVHAGNERSWFGVISRRIAFISLQEWDIQLKILMRRTVGDFLRLFIGRAIGDMERDIGAMTAGVTNVTEEAGDGI